jgi:hypothetical protein
MKPILVIAFLFICFSTMAQRDTTRRDTAWSGSPHRPYLNAVLDADVLEGVSAATTITARGQRMCFDKVIKVKTMTSRGPAEVCLFINTKIGLVAHSPIKPGAVTVCDIKQEAPDFRLNVIGLKGNTYSYFNVKKKNGIEHWVQTGNSETYQYQFTNAGANIPLKRKTERRSYCNDKVKAQAYKVDGRPEVWFLFGKTFPENITMTPKKYLGSYAVGYQYTDKGLFIIMEMEAGGYNAKIEDIQDIDVCFDPSSYQVFEDEQENKMQQSIQRQREKIAREERKTEQYPSCQSKKTTLLNYQKQSLNRQEENMQEARIGHATQNVRTQQAQANLMNYDDAIQTMIYETELKICRAEQRQAQSPSSSYEKKMRCLQNQLAAQKSTQLRFQQINTQYRNEPGKQYSEKAKAFMQGIAGCD